MGEGVSVELGSLAVYVEDLTRRLFGKDAATLDWRNRLHRRSKVALEQAAWVQCVGRHHRRSDYDWEGRWADAAGPLARSAKVERVRSVEEVSGYIAAMRKYLDLADLAESDPHRFIDRTRQMTGLHRYRAFGSLSIN